MKAEEVHLADDRRCGWRLHWLHWLIIVGSVGLTLVVWQMSRYAIDERTRALFDRETDRVVTLFTEQLQRHSDVLRATASLLATHRGELEVEEWLDYTENLDLQTQFPSLGNLGVLELVQADELDDFLVRQREQHPDFRLRPAHDHSFHLPLVLPPTSTSRALGYDLAYDEVRRDAVERAVYEDATQISAPIDLAYSQAIGFLMFTPFQGDFADPASAADEATGRAPATRQGAVVASMQASAFSVGVLGPDQRTARVRISDAGMTLYEDTRPASEPESLLTRTMTVPLFGREWHFELESTPAFERDVASAESSLILASGLFIDFLLLIIFVVLARSASVLQKKSEALEESNRTLESFAYIASHDLKTPLNSIGVLAGFVEEDLQSLAANEPASPEARQNVGRILRQVHRGKMLIDGILEYSGLGSGTEIITPVDTRELVQGIADTLQIDVGQLRLEGDFPVIETSETRLSQVLANLIGNAFKYHHEPARASVVVRVKRVGDYHRFAIEDDGPGIDPADHDRIFELFETLGSGNGVKGTGVGLAIVRKAVEHMGGSIRLDSSPGAGTTFTFDWPVHREDGHATVPENEMRAAA